MKNTITDTPRLERGLPAREIGAQAASLRMRMRKTMKALACLCLLFNFQLSIFNFPTASAQHFEWAKGYGSAANDGNSIVGTVADSQGNLYILGDFYPDAEWDGVPLMPFTPYGNAHNTRSVVVAKISPSGEMLWRKVIHANNNSMSRGFDIRMMGDTAIAFMARCNPPTRVNYLYYLDTLYANDENFFFDMTYLRWSVFTVFVVLDLDGNTLENHVMYTTYVDRDGNDIMYEQATAIGTWNVYDNNEIYEPSFDIDPEGNIYLCRWANDYISGYAGLPGYDLENGDLSAVKFWVDDRVAGVVDIPKGARYWFPQLIKFSPHLDTVLGSRYLVQRGGREGRQFNGNLVKCKSNSDVYVIWNTENERVNDTIICDSTQGIRFKSTLQDVEVGYLFAFNPLLNLKWGITIERDSIMIPELGVDTPWKDICFDEDSNLIFLSSKNYINSVNGDTTNFTAVLSYDGAPLSVQSSSALVMALRERENDIPELVRIGRFPSIYSASVAGTAKGNITCKKNRIFWQAGAQGGFVFPSGTIEFDRSYGESSLGLVILDYNMDFIAGFNFETPIGSTTGPVILHDSILYLTNYLTSGHAQFGEVLFSESPYKKYATIAKYVDTAFMTSFVEPAVTGVLDEHDINTVSIYPNPANDRIQIDLTNEVLLTASAVSMLGQHTTLNHNGTSVDVSPLAPGIYIMEIHTSMNDYKCKFIKY